MLQQRAAFHKLGILDVRVVQEQLRPLEALHASWAVGALAPSELAAKNLVDRGRDHGGGVQGRGGGGHGRCWLRDGGWRRWKCRGSWRWQRKDGWRCCWNSGFDELLFKLAQAPLVLIVIGTRE